MKKVTKFEANDGTVFDNEPKNIKETEQARRSYRILINKIGSIRS